MQYQNLSMGINRFCEHENCGDEQSNGGSGNQSLGSKLNPKSKPFAPRQPPFPPAKAASPSKEHLDENENKVDRGIKPHDEIRGEILRKIWEEERNSPSEETPSSAISNHVVAQKVISDLAVPKATNIPIMKFPPPDPSKDDFGLRSLVRNITISV